MSTKGSKKLRRTSKKGGKYAAQFVITARNKARRATKRQRQAKSPEAALRRQKREARAIQQREQNSLKKRKKNFGVA